MILDWHCKLILKKSMKNFGFDDEFIKMGANIIRHHDQMSRTATNEDIYSQKAILNFIGLFKNINELKILYVVTYCDICAVNKPLYNSSISTLLKELYKKSILAFENPELIKESITRVSKLNKMKTKYILQLDFGFGNRDLVSEELFKYLY